MINLFGATASPGYRVPSNGSTRETRIGGGAGFFGLWPQPQYRTDCLPPVDLRATTMITATATAPASSMFFAAPQPAYRDCRKKTLDDGRVASKSKATDKPAK